MLRPPLLDDAAFFETPLAAAHGALSIVFILRPAPSHPPLPLRGLFPCLLLG